MVAQTQFAHGYKSNDKTVYSDFFSPFNLNLSVGMDYTVDWLDHKLKGSATWLLWLSTGSTWAERLWPPDMDWTKASTA